MESNAADVTTVLEELQGSIHFVIKKLRPSHVADDKISARCCLMIPAKFVKAHRDKLEKLIILRSTVCKEPSTVWLNMSKRLPRSPEIKLGKGWKEFATRHALSVGDSLIFRLQGKSEFEVYVFHRTIPAISFSPNGICTLLGAAAGQDPLPLASERINGTPVDALSGWIAKKRDAGGEFKDQQSASVGHDSDNTVLQQIHVVPFNVDASPRNIESGEKFESRPLLPSFTQLLNAPNVEDSAGNTCGACFEIPLDFLNSLQSIQQLLDPTNARVIQLQGIQEESPIRTVTCDFKITQQNMAEEFQCATRTCSLCLGWGIS